MTNSIPNAQSTIYKAGAAIHQFGQMPRADLFAVVAFGPRDYIREARISAGVSLGWLTDIEGKIGITELARAHFNGEPLPEPTTPLTGIPAGPRIADSAYDRPPLRGITNSRGTDVRAIDDRFQRATDHHFFTVPVGMP